MGIAVTFHHHRNGHHQHYHRHHHHHHRQVNRNDGRPPPVNVKIQGLKEKRSALPLIIVIILFGGTGGDASGYGDEGGYGCAALRPQRCCRGRDITCRAVAPKLVYADIPGEEPDIVDGSDGSALNETLLDGTGGDLFRRRRRHADHLLSFTVDERWRFFAVCVRVNAERIGDLVLPDLIALNNVGEKYAKLFGQTTHLKIFEAATPPMGAYGKAKRSSHPHNEHYRAPYGAADQLVFGAEQVDPYLPPDRTPFLRGRSLIRYSVLNKFLPLKVEKLLSMPSFPQHADAESGHRHRSGQKNVLDSADVDGDDADDDGGTSFSPKSRLLYVAEADRHCYCDEACTYYEDCCFDYAQICRPPIPEPCHYSAWSVWSGCVRSDADGGCGGPGEESRVRTPLRGAANARCVEGTALRQMRACFRPCERKGLAPSPHHHHRPGYGGAEDLTTVALLLDYRFNESRMVGAGRRRQGQQDVVAVGGDYHPYRRHNTGRYRISARFHYASAAAPANNTDNSPTALQLLPEDDPRFDSERHRFYCVTYQLGWVNRNCVDRRWKSVLTRHRLICAECQPHAQLHRNRPRCASDLEDGERGFFKLIGPLSCNGIWYRISHQDDCRCFQRFPQLPPFLLV